MKTNTVYASCTNIETTIRNIPLPDKLIMVECGNDIIEKTSDDLAYEYAANNVHYMHANDWLTGSPNGEYGYDLNETSFDYSPVDFCNKRGNNKYAYYRCWFRKFTIHTGECRSSCWIKILNTVSKSSININDTCTTIMSSYIFSIDKTVEMLKEEPTMNNEEEPAQNTTINSSTFIRPNFWILLSVILVIIHNI